MGDKKEIDCQAQIFCEDNMERATLARALYSNTPEAKNELLFRKGDILTVIEIDHDMQPGWWLCTLRGQRGICPGNYLELIEDKYAIPHSPIRTDSSSNGNLGSDPSRESDSLLEALETYDVPRSWKVHPTASSSLRRDEDPLETYDVPRSVRLQREQKQQQLQLEEQLQNEPTYVNINTLSRTSSHQSELSLDSTGSSTQLSSASSASSARNSYEPCSILPPPGVLDSGASSPDVHFRKPPAGGSKRATVQSDSTMLSSVVPDLYDVPRSAPTSRAQSAMSMSSGLGVSITNSDSKDSLDLYDVPRTFSGVVPNCGSGSNKISSGTSANGGSLQNCYTSDGSGNFQNCGTLGNNSGTLGNNSGTLTNNDSSRHGRTSQSNSALENCGTLQNTGNSRHCGTSQGSGPRPNCGTSENSDTSSQNNLPQNHPTLQNNSGTPRNSVQAFVTQIEAKYDHVSSNYSIPPRRGNLNRRGTLSATGSISNIERSSDSILNDANERVIMRKTSDSGIPGIIGKAQVEGKKVSFNSMDDLYDVPRSHCPPVVVRKHPISSSLASIAISEDSAKNKANNSFSMTDVRRRGFIGAPQEISAPVRTLSLNDKISMRDERPGSQRRATFSRGNSNGHSFSEDTSREIEDVKILPLNPRAAVTVCEKLRQEVMAGVKSILDISEKSHWRDRENLQEIMPDLRFSCVRLNLAVKDLTDFCSRTVSNARTFSIEILVTKLQRLLNPLINASQIIQRDIDELEAYFWSVDRLSRPVDSNGRTSSSDALDQLVLCARSVQHDSTEIANFIALNSKAFFLDQERLNASANAISVGKGTPEGTNAGQNESGDVPTEDYDYVSLFSADEVDDAGNCEEINNSPSGSNSPTLSQQLVPSDQQLLEFYSTQIALICPLLSDSISTFISSVQKNDPPKTFNGHLKYVILLAYKMLFAGDTVHRNISHEGIKEQVEGKANDLHKSIVSLHEASRVAARDFPRIPPMQGIVDRVWETTAAATQLKKVILTAACL
ncbi:unnamed protein product [Allacma fusca]|uniref:SH3 domain-containing protein n=1 Tax=Allacma fusca TaxID=39272 RepID=A0A8J2LNE8_9HEXA|nr:unnamed protein product [Allacma fusca]